MPPSPGSADGYGNCGSCAVILPEAPEKITDGMRTSDLRFDQYALARFGGVPSWNVRFISVRHGGVASGDVSDAAGIMTTGWSGNAPAGRRYVPSDPGLERFQTGL